MFEKIRNKIKEDCAIKKENTFFYIEHGFPHLSSAAADKVYTDGGLKEYATPLRYKQYKDGTITRDQAVNFSKRRVERISEKEEAEQIRRLEKIENAPSIDEFNILIVKSGKSVYATLFVGDKEYKAVCRRGDEKYKTAKALADVLNSCPAILKQLCIRKENTLEEEEKDNINTSGFRNNEEVVGFRSGMEAIPTFGGGNTTGGIFLVIECCCGMTIQEKIETKYAQVYKFCRATNT